MNSFIHRPHISAAQIDQILLQAKKLAEDHELQFAGSVAPQHAWLLFQAREALIIDVRTFEERKFVGYVEHSLHIPWNVGTALQRNPNFLEELKRQIEPDKIILLMCRSGKRSAAAASVAFNAGLSNVYNIDQGFEGDLDAHLHRGTYNGWRFHRLPWVQE